MRKFIYRSLVSLCLLILGFILALIVPKVGALLGAIILLLSTFALIKPISKFYLDSRVFSLTLAIFISLPILIVSFSLMSLDTNFAQHNELAPDSNVQQVAGKGNSGNKITPSAQKDISSQSYSETDNYVQMLEREIAAIQKVTISKYTKNVKSINAGLLLIGAWGLLYDQGEDLALPNELEKKRQMFRRLVSQKQQEMFPKMRDAYGPAMRQQLWEADSSARTFGTSFKTVEFVSASFSRNLNIKQIHSEIVDNLRMLRFKRAQYKWYKHASEYTYYTIDAPKDADLVLWVANGGYQILD